MTLRINLILILLLSVAITACSPVATKSSSHEVRHGVSRVLINQVITIPLSTTRVYFQDGKIVRKFNAYRPNCNIEVRLRDDENTQSIQPAEFQVTSIQQTRQEVVNIIFDKKINLADANFSPSHEMIAYVGGDSPSDIYRGYHFYLSGEDSNVSRLSCRGVYGSPSEAKLPTLSEIRQALGDIINIL